MSQAKSAEKVVQEIRRRTRRQFSAEEKIRRCGLGQQRQTENQQRQAAALRRHDDGEGPVARGAWPVRPGAGAGSVNRRRPGPSCSRRTRFSSWR